VGRTWSGPPSTTTVVDALIAVCLVAVAVREGLRVTTGLHVPPDPDLFRSAAITQTILDGAWIADPFFAGEWNWYNPLVPAIVALLHAITGTPVLELYARSGVVLNLFGPIAFWALVRALFGSGAAVAAVFAFLFLPPRLPGWSTAGYWPWLFSSVFTQAVFYAGLIAVDRAARSMRLTQWVIAGLALGFVFLGHTAPAIVFGGVIVLAATRMWRGGLSAQRSMVLLAASLATAVVVSLPVVLSVAVRYRFAVLNDVLRLYAYPETEPGNFAGFLADHANAGTALALAGAPLLLRDREQRRRAWVIGYWAVVNGAILLVHFGRPLLESAGLHVPQVVTAFHFILYAEALLMILAGYALWRIVETAGGMVTRTTLRVPPAIVARALLAVVVLLSVGPLLPARRAREDFDESHTRAVAYQNRQDERRVREWIRTTTPPGTVFLASYRLSLYAVAPAGGKVVALDPVFANPYVDLAARERDQRKMEERIFENDRNGYCLAASRYDVQYVIGDAQRQELAVPENTFLEEVLSADGVRIFRAPDCGRGGV
jgi:hypothetical protein